MVGADSLLPLLNICRRVICVQKVQVTGTGGVLGMSKCTIVHRLVDVLLYVLDISRLLISMSCMTSPDTQLHYLTVTWRHSHTCITPQALSAPFYHLSDEFFTRESLPRSPAPPSPCHPVTLHAQRHVLSPLR